MYLKEIVIGGKIEISDCGEKISISPGLIINVDDVYGTEINFFCPEDQYVKRGILTYVNVDDMTAGVFDESDEMFYRGY